jgi:hypothetical protein
MRLQRIICGSLLISAITTICCPQPVLAEEFRIETDVFVGDAKEPVAETLTIFTNGVVYDFLLTGVEEITLFDPARDRLVLMDTKRKIKTELTMNSILEFVAHMKVQLSDDHRSYLLGETAEMETDDEGWLALANEQVMYRAECIKPEDKTTAAEYREFADWYARLNAMRPGNLPPFMRLRLNSEIARRGMLPKTIELTISKKRVLTDKSVVVRSKHLANWRLSSTDRKWIDRAGTHLANYPTVTFREYIQLPSVAASETSD